MSGLRELWDLGDPAAPDQEALQRIEHDKRVFLHTIGRLNTSLQYTAAHAPQTSHDELASRRDELFNNYQQAVAAGDDDPNALQEVLAQATGLGDEAAQLAQSTRDLKERWESQAATLESTEDAVAHVSGQSDVAAPLQRGLSKVAEAAKRRDYQTALDELDVVVGEAKTLPPTTAALHQESETAVNEQHFELKAPLDRPPVVPTDPEALANWDNPLIDGDPRELFRPERMDDVVDMHFQGEATAEDPRLNEAMNAVIRAGPDADEAELLVQFQEIGELRGIPPEVIEGQLQRFRQLQGVAQQLGEPDEASTTRREEYLETHSDFLGTQSSLRFGQVVGEATGLDPAFAALLSPTGGMVGPGMDVLAPTDANSPVILHGIFHDAGGYLLNYQNSGPGYTYLEDKQPESGRRGADPLQGQVEGVSYWYEREQSDRSLLEDLYEPDFTAEDPENKQLAYDRFVKHPIEDAEATATNLTEDAVNEVRELTADARQFSQESVDGLKNATHAAGDAVQEQVEGAQQAVDAMADTARELGVDGEMVDAAQQAIRSELQAAHDQVEEWEEGISAKFDAAGEIVEENLQKIEQWTDGAGAAVQQKTSELADDVEQAVHDELVRVAQDKGLQETLRRGANFVGETKQDVETLVATVEGEIENAKAQVGAFYDEAVESIGNRAEQLAGVKDDLIDKLAATQDTAARSVEQIQRRIDGVAGDLSATGQNILDAAGGVADSMEDVVSAGTDTLANVMGSATDSAADRLDSLTNLLG